MIYDKFKRNLRMLRANADISAASLSLDLNMGLKRIGNIESKDHTPKVGEITAIAEYFKVSIDDLMHKDCKISFE